MTSKPSNITELKSLIENGDIEILLQEDIGGELTRILICDHRRTFEEGEIYEIMI